MPGNEIMLDGRRYEVRDDPNNVGTLMAPRVLRAMDVLLHKECVIRFKETGSKRELLALNRASERNSNVPGVLNFGNDRKLGWYLVLEWVGNDHTLYHYMGWGRNEGRPRFEPETALKQLIGLVHGLKKLHTNGVIHGDIKPKNVVVEPNSNRLLLIDFGEAWTMERARGIQHGHTPGYAAPEQEASRGLVDERADQFSAAVMFYELLALDMPYESLGGRAARARRPPRNIPLEKRHPGVWPSLSEAIERSLALDPNGRYPNTSAWLNALEDAQRRQTARDLPWRIQRAARNLIPDWRDIRERLIPYLPEGEKTNAKKR